MRTGILRRLYAFHCVAAAGGVHARYNERRLGVAVLLARPGRMAPVALAGDVSQPAVSQAIARPEQDPGQPLFVRTRDCMRLAHSVRGWLASFERVLAELRDLPRSLGVPSA